MSDIEKSEFDEGRYHQLVEGEERLRDERGSLSQEVAATSHLTPAQLAELLLYNALMDRQKAAAETELKPPSSPPDLS